jgi:FkbM family methyltransferase
MRARLAAAVVMALARHTRYVEAELLGLGALVGPGSVCVDVGSAAGLYTVALARLAGPSGQVHSVEPLSFAHPVWTRLLGARTAANVRHHVLALGAEPGDGIMSVPVGRHGVVTGRSFLAAGTSGLASNAEFAGQVEVSVPVDTLDRLCARAGLNRLDFVKIDVEGAELSVLRGARHVIDAFRPALLIEIEARHTARYRYSPEHLAHWLSRRGYTMHAWRHRWDDAAGITPGTRNYLFRPPAAPVTSVPSVTAVPAFPTVTPDRDRQGAIIGSGRPTRCR